jgi:predicted glycosyltransferase
MIRSPRCLFYAHDGYGMGHIGRSVCLAEQLKKMFPKWDILIATGDKQAIAMLPSNVELVKLPSFSKIPDSDNAPQLTPAALSSFALTITLRKKILTTLFDTFTPSVVVVDYSVRGLGRELSGTLNNYKAKNPNSRIILGLRGVLGKKEHIARELFSPANMDFIKRFYDNVFVYTDKSVIDVASFYDLPAWFEEKIVYTGYVTVPSRNNGENPNDQDRLGLSIGEKYLGIGMGSGVGAESILKELLNALTLVRSLPEKKVVVTGPKFSFDTYRKLIEEYPHIIFRHYVADYSAFVTDAAFFVGLAGYNTIAPWLKRNNPALFLARDQMRGEQQLHLQALEKLGLCLTMDEKDAYGEKLVKKLETLIKNKNKNHNLVMHGETLVAEFINSFGHRP